MSFSHVSLPSLVIALSVSSSVLAVPLLDTCRHQYEGDPHLSAWQELLLTGTFAPARDGSDHHLLRLTHKLAELEAVIHHNKDDYTSQVFGYSFLEISSDLQTVEYNQIFSEVYQTKAGDTSAFSEAYQKFQTLYLATEMITNDLDIHEANQEVVRLWNNVNNLLLDVLKNLYTELIMQGTSLTSPVPRSRLPRSLKCMAHSSYRDTRDFVILRHLLRISQASLEIFES